MPVKRAWIRTLLAVFANLYVVALAIYLLLRLAFGDGLWWLALLNNLAIYYFAPLLVVLILALLLRDRGMLARGGVLALIGLVWFGPMYLPKTVAAPSGATLKVVTFNVLGINPHFDRVAEWLRQTDADVILLQEVPGRFLDIALPQLADLYPYSYGKDFPSDWWRNLALSRYPIVESDVYIDPDQGVFQNERMVLDINGRKQTIYNVHFEFPMGDTPHPPLPVEVPFFRYDDTTRDAQITALLDRVAQEPNPYLVGGDFNMSDQAVMYGQLAARMTDSYREAGVGLGATWPTHGFEVELPDFMKPVMRIDYLWHSVGLRTVRIERGPELGSDHLPLAATFELKS
jgi:vancomycin resistance protein VanJ